MGAFPFPHVFPQNFSFSQSNTQTSRTDDVKDVAQLRVDLRDSKHEVEMLKHQIEMMKTTHAAELGKKESEVRVEMMDAVEKAYTRGHAACATTMKEAKALFGSL